MTKKFYNIEEHNKQLTPEEVKQAAAVGVKRLMWAVCSTIDHTAKGCQQDDNRDKVQTIATFSDPFAAEDFIKKVLPAENIDRFYIVQFENLTPLKYGDLTSFFSSETGEPLFYIGPDPMFKDCVTLATDLTNPNTRHRWARQIVRQAGYDV